MRWYILYTTVWVYRGGAIYSILLCGYTMGVLYTVYYCVEYTAEVLYIVYYCVDCTVGWYIQYTTVWVHCEMVYTVYYYVVVYTVYYCVGIL